MPNQLKLQLTGVPRTMLLTTRSRVDEHQQQNRLFSDPTIFEWWQFLTWDEELDPLYNPIGQFAWANRAHIIDRLVQKHLQKYPDAIVVELGAGLSTRYYRVGKKCHHWFELDLPEIIDLRRQLDLESNHHSFISRSVLDFSWMAEIPATAPEKILFVAEGLLMYFQPEQVTQSIEQLSRRFAGATFVFDVVGGVTKGKAAKFLASIGAPLQWFVKNERDLTEMGLTLVEVRSLVQENCRYPHRIGIYRWIPWISKLPPLRNAALILETKIKRQF
ncbi:class I SAM-dependent methyltransferase [Pleurocapsales cyanobacterium LEGE 06147]|nr:class I SAM-dependent methyltransferase [Pleurocapsales cyanobacterium LEGE 06147]